MYACIWLCVNVCVYVCVYVCVCMYVSEHDSVWTVHSIEFKFGMYITGHRRTNPTDFDEYRVNAFLQEYKK